MKDFHLTWYNYMIGIVEIIPVKKFSELRKNYPAINNGFNDVKNIKESINNKIITTQWELEKS